MNSVTTELQVALADIESGEKETSTLSPDQLSMIAGGQCTTNSI
jgi:hypothetical protein